MRQKLDHAVDIKAGGHLGFADVSKVSGAQSQEQRGTQPLALGVHKRISDFEVVGIYLMLPFRPADQRDIHQRVPCTLCAGRHQSKLTCLHLVAGLAGPRHNAGN